MKALVTGFDAFGGDAINPSCVAVQSLPARIGTLEVVTAVLPTSFRRATTTLRALMRREQPDIVLCVGLAADRAAISIERVAVNLDDARLPGGVFFVVAGAQNCHAADSRKYSV